MSDSQAKIEEELKQRKLFKLKELKNLWVDNFVPAESHPARRTFISGDVTVSAMEPIIMRPKNEPLKRDMHLLLTMINEETIIRVFYNFNNLVNFDLFIGEQLNAFGETKEIKSIAGIKDIHFSHVFTRNNGETVGAKVRATLVAFKVTRSEKQLPYTVEHSKWLDIFMDPYSDVSNAERILSTPRVVGAFYENENLAIRSFPETDDADVKLKFSEIEEHLKARTNDCESFIRRKLGL